MDDGIKTLVINKFLACLFCFSISYQLNIYLKINQDTFNFKKKKKKRASKKSMDVSKIISMEGFLSELICLNGDPKQRIVCFKLCTNRLRIGCRILLVFNLFLS